MTSRREARRTALDILYQADITDTPADAVCVDWRDAGRTFRCPGAPAPTNRVGQGALGLG